jgi:hypothetical protein
MNRSRMTEMGHGDPLIKSQRLAQLSYAHG